MVAVPGENDELVEHFDFLSPRPTRAEYSFVGGSGPACLADRLPVHSGDRFPASSQNQ